MNKVSDQACRFDSKGIFYLLSIFLITTLLYLPSLKFGFLTDDDPAHIILNPLIRSLSWENIVAIFQSNVNLTYHPLTLLSHTLEYRFFGFNPFFYHLDNLLLHLGVVSGVFFFVLRLRLPLAVAWLSALIFAVHPMHVESVAWLTERKDVLYAFFYVWGLNLYAVYVDTGKKNYYALCLLLGLLSILSKAMALSFPLILFVYDWYIGRKFTKAVLWEKVPAFFLILPIAWITYSLNARALDVLPGEAVLTWIWTFVFYIQRFLFPFLLLPIYNLSKPVILFNWHYFVAVIAFGLIGAGLCFFRHNRLFIFAALYYFVSIFFLLRYDDTVDVNVVADRFMYLPSLGICILLGVGIRQIFERSYLAGPLTYPAALCILGIAFGLLVFKAGAQIHVWGDDVLLWSGVIKHFPNESCAYGFRGYAYLQHRDFDKAIADYTRLIQIKTDDPKGFIRGTWDEGQGRLSRTYNNRGAAYFAIQEYEKAMADYDTALRIEPGQSMAAGNRALLYMTMKNLGKWKQ